MSEINSDEQFRQTRALVYRLKNLRQRTERVLTDFNIPNSDDYIEVIDRNIESNESELARYAAYRAVDPDGIFDILSRLPELLKHARVWLGWSQTDLGKNTGIHPRDINKYEKAGYRRTNLETILKITKVLTTAIDGRSQACRREIGFLQIQTNIGEPKTNDEWGIESAKTSDPTILKYMEIAWPPNLTRWDSSRNEKLPFDEDAEFPEELNCSPELD